MRCTELILMPFSFAIMAAVQWVASAGGSLSVRATTRSATSVPSGGMREGRVLSRNRLSKPPSMKRCCQRQTQVFDLALRRMISLVPSPLGRQQHDLGSPDVLLRSVAVPDEGLKAPALDRRDGDGNPGAHAPDSHAQTPEGIPQGIQSLDFDH